MTKTREELPEIAARLEPFVHGLGKAILRELITELDALTAQSVDAARWQPIETAPTDNKRPLLIARFYKGSLRAVDHNASYEAEQESWELPEIYYVWMSENGYVDEPTHWMYQPDWYAAMSAQQGEQG